jgi:hypothetical protein
MLLDLVRKTMKKYLACALLAIGLTLSVEAQTTYTTNGWVPPPPVTVPDNGSTAVLLGAGLAALALVSRRLATR